MKLYRGGAVGSESVGTSHCRQVDRPSGGCVVVDCTMDGFWWERIDVKDVLAPPIALTILMESAIYASKLMKF